MNTYMKTVKTVSTTQFGPVKQTFTSLLCLGFAVDPEPNTSIISILSVKVINHHPRGSMYGAYIYIYTYITHQGINISHMGNRKIIFKSTFKMGYVSSQEGNP